jgi:hypothetical protein
MSAGKVTPDRDAMPNPGHLRDEAVQMWVEHRRTPRQLAERLELWATLETGEKIAVGCDGIASRDATIELLDKRIAALSHQRDELRVCLEECEVYFEDRADVIDDAHGEPAPNREMFLLQVVREDSELWDEITLAIEQEWRE